MAWEPLRELEGLPALSDVAGVHSVTYFTEWQTAKIGYFCPTLLVKTSFYICTNWSSGCSPFVAHLCKVQLTHQRNYCFQSFDFTSDVRKYQRGLLCRVWMPLRLSFPIWFSIKCHLCKNQTGCDLVNRTHWSLAGSFGTPSFRAAFLLHSQQ